MTANDERGERAAAAEAAPAPPEASGGGAAETSRGLLRRATAHRDSRGGDSVDDGNGEADSEEAADAAIA